MSIQLEYVLFLILNLIGNNKPFAEALQEHQNKNKEVEDLNASYDEELVDYMIELLKSNKPIDFRKYDKSEQLFAYINGLLLVQKKRDEKRYQVDYIEYMIEKNKTDKIKAVDNYSFADSNLYRLEFNSQKKECKLFFRNGTFYNDKNNDIAESTNIMLLLYEVEGLKITGIFDFELIKSGRVYSSRFNKVSDTLHCLTLLCIVNYEHFIIEVNYANILVEKMNISYK